MIANHAESIGYAGNPAIGWVSCSLAAQAASTEAAHKPSSTSVSHDLAVALQR
jgi:hypothetical protein